MVWYWPLSQELDQGCGLECRFLDDGLHLSFWIRVRYGQGCSELLCGGCMLGTLQEVVQVRVRLTTVGAGSRVTSSRERLLSVKLVTMYCVEDVVLELSGDALGVRLLGGAHSLRVGCNGVAWSGLVVLAGRSA
jgi:hypothetical protein